MSKFIILITLILSQIIAGIEAQNPLQGKPYYVNPNYQANIDKTIQSVSPNEPDSLRVVSNLRVARDAPSAFWLDLNKKVEPDDTSLESMNGILLDAAKKSPAPMALFVVKNLPNKDCSSNSSVVEICCSTGADGKCDFTQQEGTCTQGLETYKNSFVNNIITVINKHKATVPMAFIIEPNSVGNIVSNGGKDPRCGNATVVAYKEGLQYTINEINKAAPAAPMYLDLAHGGWLGWANNANGTAVLVNSLDILGKIRGFATNVGNYQPIGKACPATSFCLPNKNNTENECCSDPCGLNEQFNPANNELNYVMEMEKQFPGKKFVVDTGRNGVAKSRETCSNWCNARNAGLGSLPTTDTPLPAIDAFLWLKTPGEADGCTQSLPSGDTCPLFDNSCASVDSIGSNPGEPRMPEAGKWSEFQMKTLAKNAQFGASITLAQSKADSMQYAVYPLLVIIILHAMLM